METFDSVFEGECDDNIDEVRRALLTRGLKNYPRIFRGYTNYSFGWEWDDWHVLIKDNSIIFKSFFDDIIMKSETPSSMINNPQNTNTEFAEFVKYPCLLKYCEEKNIQWSDMDGWILIKRKNASNCISLTNYLLKIYLDTNLKKSNWSIWIYDKNLVVVENKKANTVFDIWWHDRSWNISFFKRDAETKESLKTYINDEWSFDDEEGKYMIKIDCDCKGYGSICDKISKIIDMIP